MTDDRPDGTSLPRKALRLKREVGRRVERGHLWVFANEVEAIEGNPAPGDEVSVFSAKRRFLGMALLSGSSLLRARIYSRQWDQACDGVFIRHRIEQALAFRRDLGELPPAYRLIHGEADGLPGAVVDVFGDHLVIQISTQGMEQRRDLMIAALQELIAPKVILERSDMSFRELEGLAPRNAIVSGQPDSPLALEENGIKVLSDLMEGQKTGYYLDQVSNRARAARFFEGRRVLDLFCYVGAWSILAAARGAAEVTGIDSSARALTLARRSLELNAIPDGRCAFLEEDVFAFLRRAVQEKRQYDTIILDPPALAKNRREVESAKRAYRELNIRAMQLTAPGGLLVTCSCSHNLSEGDLQEILTLAAKDSSTDWSILDRPSQPPDHPVHLQTPETGYLKSFFLRRRDW